MSARACSTLPSAWSRCSIDAFIAFLKVAASRAVLVVSASASAKPCTIVNMSRLTLGPTVKRSPAAGAPSIATCTPRNVTFCPGV